MGGTLISGRLGKQYQVFLRNRFSSESGNGGRGDLCAYFFLRATQLLRSDGSMGLIGTKTIGEGDTKTIGLAEIIRRSFQIYCAQTNIPWPGAAGVSVSLVWIYRGHWQSSFNLNGSPVSSISPSLNSISQTGTQPKPLSSNIGLACEGVRTIGMGFVIELDEAQQLLADDKKNEHVVLPFVDGRDINSNPTQETSRYCICFYDWSEERAKEYEQPWRLIEDRVKPERQRLKGDGSFQLRSPMPQRYWQFGDARMAFRRRSVNLKKILVVVQTSKYVAASFQKNDRVLSQSLVMMASDDYGLFGVINSAIHSSWIQMTCSNMGATQRYIVTDGFNTYPFPDSTLELQEIGQAFNESRTRAMSEHSFGLTDVYNALHDPGCSLEELVALRTLQLELDRAVARAYGWDDLDFEHGFHEIPYLPKNDRVRFTISETARVEVLRRMSELNRQRYEEEVTQGLHGGTGARTPCRAVRAAPAQPSLDFETRGAVTANGVTPSTAILDFLRTHDDWLAKADLLAATGVTDGQWNAAITDLIFSGKVERQGERRGARYRLIE
jgi:hypothetical protein